MGLIGKVVEAAEARREKKDDEERASGVRVRVVKETLKVSDKGGKAVHEAIVDGEADGWQLEHITSVFDSNFFFHTLSSGSASAARPGAPVPAGASACAAR